MAELHAEMWVCRSRSHQWPQREMANACCHTHQVELRLGRPHEHEGPEPILPFAHGAGFYFALVPSYLATQELVMLIEDPDTVPADELRRASKPFGERWADREVVPALVYRRAIDLARMRMGVDVVQPHHVESYLAEAALSQD